MFKKLILTALVTLVMATGAFAATANLNVNASVSAPPITIVKDQDMVLAIDKNPVKTAYVDTDTEWRSAQPAKFHINGDYSTAFQLTIPPSITLNKGADTSVVTLNCRRDTAAYPVDKTAGAACGTSGVSAANGDLFVDLFATASNFSVANTGGVYNGTLPITVNY